MGTKLNFDGVFGSKRSLTIECPDALGTVIKDPSTYYRDLDVEEDDNLHYPDALFVPNNGSKITGWYVERTKRHYRIEIDGEGKTKLSFTCNQEWTRIEDRNGWHYTKYWDTDGNDCWTELETNVQIVPKQGVGMWEYELTNNRTPPLAEEAFYQYAFQIDYGLRQAQKEEAEWKPNLAEYIQEHPYDGAIWFEPEEIVYHIIGIPEYFKSNAKHYFAIEWSLNPLNHDLGDSEDCTCYFGDYFDSKTSFGSLEFSKGTGKYYYSLDKSQGFTALIENEKYKYQSSSPHDPLSFTNERIRENGDGFNGYRSSISLRNIRNLTNHPNITFKDTNFVFRKEQLVAMKLPNETSSYKAFGLQGDEKQLKILSRSPDSQIPHNLVISGLSKILKFIKEDEHEYLLFYKRDMSSILSGLGIESNLANFTGKYLVNGRLNGNSYIERWVSENTRTPMTKSTLLIEPIFSVPVCAYTNLCTVNDHNGAMKFEKRDEKIKNELESLFLEEELQYNKVDNWSVTTVREELKKLKESKAKFKVLFIKAHGGKYQNVPEKLDKSYCVMSEGNKKLLDFDDIKYLLKDGKSDEYYMIVCNSCYGGGIVEDFLHTDINLTSYSSVIPSSELKANYVFMYSDCANSPGWAENADLYRFDPTDQTYGNVEAYQYQNQGSRINALIQETRTKNLNELIGLLSRHYQTLKSMLKLDKFFWTDQTFSDSLTNAGNLILGASKDTFDHFNVNGGSEWNQMARKYPIVFLLWRVLGQLDGGKNETSVWNDSQLVYGQTPSLFQFITDPQLFKNASMRFVRNNPNSINQRTKYLLQTDESINRALEGDDIEENVKRLNEIIGFFYDCFCTWRQMVKNSEPITSLNGKKYHWLQTLLLDDKPGIVINGDWSGTAFPKFPGSDMVAGITLEKIQELEYTRGT